MYIEVEKNSVSNHHVVNHEKAILSISIAVPGKANECTKKVRFLQQLHNFQGDLSEKKFCDERTNGWKDGLTDEQT